MLKLTILATLLGLILVSCGSTDSSEMIAPNQGELIFNSGFEGESKGTPEGAHADIIGIDHSLSGPNDWEAFDAHPNIGDFTFQYEGGNPSERFAALVPDPLDETNTVLQFWLKTPNVLKDGVRIKGRVQANLNNNTGLKEILHKGRVYFSPNFEALTALEERFGWLTIFEYWNNPSWQGYDFPFRLTVNIKKLDEAAGTPLTFGLHGQELISDKFTNVWEVDNETFEVPIGDWVNYEIYFKEGDQNNGRFRFDITSEGEKTTVFDVTNYTHHPDDPSPDGLSHFNPMKLYTFSDLINYLSERDQVLQIYWDDFELWKDKKPEE